MLGFSEILRGLLALVFFAYLVVTGIGWFAFPFALLAWATVATHRRHRAERSIST